MLRSLERCIVFLLRTISRLLLVLLSLPTRLSRIVEWVPGRPSSADAGVGGCSWSVSSPTEPLLLLPGVELARRIRQRKVKCIDVVQAYVNRIQEVNPMVNALVKDRYEEALQEARQVDEMLLIGEEDEESLKEKLPFLGVPLTVKEAFALHGMPNSAGLVARRNVISNTDAIVVARLKQAGAIPLGVTNCSELCMWYESSNNVYGRSNNPYDIRRIVGGSSGGEGCILGAAGSPMGVGSDIGGSIRMPAFFNGIFGHKPTQGVVPNEGQFPNATGAQKDLLSTGPMCRYAEDLEPMLRVMAGSEVSKLKLDKEVSLMDIKFYSMEHDGGSMFVSPVDQEIIQAHRRVVEHLESQLGVSVQHVEIRKMKYSFQIWSALMSKEIDGQEEPSFTDLLGDHGKAVWPVWELMKWLLGLSSHTLPAIALAVAEKLVKLNPSRNAKLESMARNLRTEMVNFLGDDGVLLYPSHPKIAPKHHLPLGMPFNFAYTGIFNILGLPVTQCPLGLSSEGLPLGIQLVAGHFNDHLTLSVAKYLEKAFGGWALPGRS
ncbi:fatty-acid amide hydrolase 2 [Microcaecilia unicolor]|uniref:Fatty-acid amide hydrolase 2 n=1 Tax=Microcaecilia unicolor TaxID=1415580 RepID=A0A6P7YSM0_9AMPH|nr:fatty-acid amide hydrolase 2 [Microcaecilia unicolor]